MAGFWTCQRKSKGVPCRTRNARTKQRCAKCGGPRPPRRLPAHRRALVEMKYEAWSSVYGEACGICGAGRKTRRLDRDHDHRTGRPRGLLCSRCNRALPNWMTSAWLRAAADYLDRAQAA